MTGIGKSGGPRQRNPQSGGIVARNPNQGGNTGSQWRPAIRNSETNILKQGIIDEIDSFHAFISFISH